MRLLNDKHVRIYPIQEAPDFVQVILLFYFYSKFKFIGFSGIQYAEHVLKMVIVPIIQRYKVFTHYKCIEDVVLMQNFTALPADGFKIWVEKR